MDGAVVAYLVPHAASLVVQALVLAYSLRHRRVPGATELAALVGGQVLWTAGYILEVLEPTLGGKIFWDDLEYVGTCGWCFGMFAFGVRFSGRRLPRPRLVWGVHLAVAGTYLALVFTDPLHGLIRPTAELVATHGVVQLVYPFTTATWIVYGYLLAVFGVSTTFIAIHTKHVRASYRRQVWIVLAGVLLPLFGSTLTLLELTPALYRDVSPIFFAAGDSLIAWGLFRFQFFEIVPIARDVVFDDLQDSVIVVDMEGRVVDLNQAVLRVIDRPAKAVIGKPAEEVFSTWQDVVRRFEDVEEIRTDLEWKNGLETVYSDLSIRPLRNARGELVGRVCVAHDVTALKNAQRALEQRNVELLRLNEDLDRYSHMVSHDLRAPLRAISGFAARLSAIDGARSEEARELVARIQANASRMQALTDDLLAFARLGRRPVRKERISPRELVEAVIESLRPQFAGRAVEFAVSDLPPCDGDPSLLRQVFENLIGNAVKFTRGRDPAHIEVGSRAEGDGFAYFVRDDGVGFTPGDPARLFGIFQRFHGEDEFEGTGVGLATVQHIVTRHGGRVWAESVEGRGSTFWFTVAPPGA